MPDATSIKNTNLAFTVNNCISSTKKTKRCQILYLFKIQNPPKKVPKVITAVCQKAQTVVHARACFKCSRYRDDPCGFQTKL